MDAKKELIKTIDTLPNSLVNELLDYANYLMSKNSFNKLPDKKYAVNEDDIEYELIDRVKQIKNGEAKFISTADSFERIDKI